MADKEQVQQELEQAKATEEPKEEDVFSVDPPDDPDEQPPEKQPGTRQQKRTNRYKEAKEEAERERAARAELEQEVGRLRIQAEVAANMVRMGQMGQKPDPQKDPLDNEIESVTLKQRVILEDYQRRMYEAQHGGPAVTQEDYLRTYKEAQELADQRQMLITQKALKQQRPDNRTEQEALWANLKFRYPDVTARPEVFAYADRVFANMKARGMTHSTENMDAAINEARQAFRMPIPTRQSPPNEKNRRQFAGVQPGARGGEGPQRQIVMTKARKGMAEKMFRGIPPEEAHAKWAQTVGKQILEEGGE